MEFSQSSEVSEIRLNKMNNSETHKLVLDPEPIHVYNLL